MESVTDSQPIICPECGADARDGFVTETTSYQAYERIGGKFVKSRHQRGVGTLVRCLPCGKLLAVTVDQVLGKAPVDATAALGARA